MSYSKLMRWSGLAALLGGALFVVLDILESILFGNQPYSEAAASGTWVIVQAAYILVFMLVGLGLIGLYIFHAQQAGPLGLVAFLLAFIGGMLATGAAWSEAFWSAWLAGSAPEILSTDPSGVLLAGAVLTIVVFTLGWLLFGIASLRGGFLPRGSAALLIIGILLYLVGSLLELPFAGVIFGAAVGWMGYALWSRSDTPEWRSILAAR